MGCSINIAGAVERRRSSVAWPLTHSKEVVLVEALALLFKQRTQQR